MQAISPVHNQATNGDLSKTTSQDVGDDSVAVEGTMFRRVFTHVLYSRDFLILDSLG